MFDTWVINLDKDIQNFNILKEKLSDKEIEPKRYSAIYGKMIKDFKPYKKYITSHSQYFGPSGQVGCGLSHYTLLDLIYNKYKLSSNKFSLILEDDAIPLFKDKKELDEIINGIPDECDILFLYCQGKCGYGTYGDKKYIKKNTAFTVGAVAYFVRHSSIPKIIKNKINFHIDIQWYINKNINTYLYAEKIFSVDKSTSYNTSPYKKNFFTDTLDNMVKLDNMTVTEALKFRVFKIPFTNIELDSIEMYYLFNTIGIILLIIIVLIVLKYKKII
tara:strand:- start:245 stop:1066 length:822 start_codon:yes stop_codon:yes gene_type:complete